MKKIFTLLSLFLLGGMLFSQISSYPYTQDFESFSTCSPNCGAACTLSSFWNNDVTDGMDWTVDIGGTTSGNTGPSVDHNPGTSTGKYLYMETSSPCNGSTVVANLESPWFNFTNVGSPTVKFWYHMFGATMGTMHIDVDTVGGGAWILDVIPSWTANTNLWQEQTVFMNPYAGLDSVRFRIRGIVGSSFLSDMAVDDVTVFDLPAIDLGVTSVDSLFGGCNLTTQSVWINVINDGSDSLVAGTNIPVFYSDGTTTVADTFTLASTLSGLGGNANFQFTVPVDLSTPGDYTITAWVGFPGDSLAANDTASSAVITSVPTVSTLPYFETFENGTGGWTPGGTNSSWEYGTFAGAVIGPGPTCGANGWATNLTGSYNNSENSFLLSPCIDFSSLTTDPTLRFLHNLNIESGFDQLWLETSTNGGATWTRLGVNGGLGTNWYNTTNNDWDGTAGWRIASHPLTGMAGVANGAIRFVFTSDGSVTPEGTGIDDIIISAGAISDAAPLALVAPVSACGLTNADTVVAQFKNNGTDTLAFMDVCYVLDNGTPVCDSIAGPIFPGDTVTFAFGTTGDFSSAGVHTVLLTTAVPNDLNTCNDSITFSVTNIPLVNTFPYLERFEAGPGAWTVGGTNTTWTWGTPAKNTIQGAGSGVNAWVTGGLGTLPYNASENGFVISPCFDFTNAPAGQWVALKIWWNSEFSWDGANLQVTTDDGVTWSNIGAVGDPFNWYNDNSINGAPGGSQEGWTGRGTTGSGGYVFAKHQLDSSLVGQPAVRFRLTFGSDTSVQDDGVAFDDFAIGIPTQVSLGPDTTICGGEMITTDRGMVGQLWEWSNGATGPMIQLINTSGVDRIDTLSVIYTDTLGLCTEDTIIVTVQSTPFVDVADTTICFDGTVTLDASASNATAYLWSTGDTSSTLTVGPGSYAVEMSNPGTNSCSYTDSVTVSSFAVANIGAANVGYCPGDTVMLDAGIAPASYLWNTGDTTQSIMVSMDGTYMVSVTDTNGCTSMDTAMTMAEAPISLQADTLLCDGAMVTLDASAVSGSYLWSTGDSTATVDVSTAGSYSVTVISSPLGCVSSDSVEITTAQSPVADYTFVISGGAGLEYTFTDASTGGTPTSWAWDFGDSNTDTQQNPVHTYAVDGNYDVTLIVTNICGSDTTTQSLSAVGVTELLPNGTVSVYPNPNNGSFFVSLKGLSGEATIEVYTLYGQLIQTQDLGLVISDRTEGFTMQNASKGVYFVKVTVDGRSSFDRIVVQ